MIVVIVVLYIVVAFFVVVGLVVFVAVWILIGHVLQKKQNLVTLKFIKIY